MREDIQYKGAFGIQLSDNAVRIAQLTAGKGGVQVCGYASRALPPDVICKGLVKKQKPLADIITRALREALPRPISSKKAIVSIPEHKSFVKIIEVPRMEKEELVEAIKWEAEDNIPLPLEKVYYDWKILDTPAPEGKMNVLVVAASKNVIDAAVEVFTLCGVTPVGFEPDSFALNRCFGGDALLGAPATPAGSKSKEEAIVYVGDDKSVVVIRSGGSIFFSSSIFFNSKELEDTVIKGLAAQLKGGMPATPEEIEQKRKELAERFKIFGFDQKYPEGKDHARLAKESMQELVKEVGDALNYFESEHEDEEKIEAVYLTGSAVGVKGFDALLGVEIGREIAEGRELLYIPIVHNVITIPKEEIPGYAIVLGSALAGVS